MPQIGIRSLRDEASRIVHRAQAGERFVVTRHNRPAALLIGISEARDFVFTHAEEFVALREEGRSELAGAAGAAARARRAVALSPGAAVRIARLRGTPRGRVDSELRRLAACLRDGRPPVEGPGGPVWQRDWDGPFMRLRTAWQWLACEALPRGRLGVSAVVAEAELDRWLWSGKLQPLRVSVAELRAGRPWSEVEDLMA
jgi:prevent-host-death family protein